MAAFTTVGPGWLVEDIGNEKYHVYVVWLVKGGLLSGVASGDGLEELLESAAIGAVRSAVKNVSKRLDCYPIRFDLTRVGPTPGARPVSMRVEVSVVPGEKKGAWAVRDIRDVRPKRPKKKVAR